jgi:hypothetical protein
MEKEICKDGPGIDKDALIYELQMKLTHANRIIDAYAEVIMTLGPHLIDHVK